MVGTSGKVIAFTPVDDNQLTSLEAGRLELSPVDAVKDNTKEKEMDLKIERNLEIKEENEGVSIFKLIPENYWMFLLFLALLTFALLFIFLS